MLQSPRSARHEAALLWVLLGKEKIALPCRTEPQLDANDVVCLTHVTFLGQCLGQCKTV